MPHPPTTTSYPDSSSILRFARPSLLVFWVFLLGLFLLAAFGWSFFLWGGEAAISLFSGKTKPPAPAKLNFEAFPRLPDSLEKELREAFDPPFNWGSQTITNPFLDQEGLTGAKLETNPALANPVKPNSALAPNLRANLRTPLPGSLPSAQSVRTLVPAALTSATPQLSAEETPPQLSPEEKRLAQKHALQSRLQTREQQLRDNVSSAPSLASCYGWQDVFPLGSVGDETRREIVFYSSITEQSFAAGAGEKFFDAELVRFDEKGVTFFVDSREEFVGWTRLNEVKTTASKAAAVSLPPALPGTEGQSTPTPLMPTSYPEVQEAVRNRYPRPHR